MSATQEKVASNNGEPKGQRSLVAEVSGQLRAFIDDGELKPGDKLPSEAGLTQQYAVSRTVVREAIASLRADGLIDVRHGVGAFVREPTDTPTVFAPADQARISSMIELLEVWTRDSTLLATAQTQNKDGL